MYYIGEVGFSVIPKPGATIFPIVVESGVLKWIVQRPTIGWIDASSIHSDRIDAVDFIAGVEKAFAEPAPDEASTARYKNFLHAYLLLLVWYSSKGLIEACG
jgi:hypothetical protein